MFFVSTFVKVSRKNGTKKNRWHINPIRIWTQFSHSNPRQTNWTKNVVLVRADIASEDDVESKQSYCLILRLRLDDVRQCQEYRSYLEIYVHSLDALFSFWIWMFPFFDDPPSVHLIWIRRLHFIWQSIWWHPTRPLYTTWRRNHLSWNCFRYRYGLNFAAECGAQSN